MFLGPSFFPLIFSILGGVVFLGLFEWFFFCDFNLWLIGIFLVVLFLFFRDLGREYKYYGMGSNLFCIKMGCVLFIFSEVLLFLSLFWLNFNFLFSVDSVLGNVWPSVGIVVFSDFFLPVLNSFLLLSSSVCLTIFHDFFNILFVSFFFCFCTIGLGVVFLFIQQYEYFDSGFSKMDSVFGGGFFMITGFHMAHVFLGALFLFCIFVLLFFGYINLKQVFLDFGVWYWHFVDVVWLYVFGLIYVWGF